LRDIALYHGDGHGWIEVITGVMFSGKSEELIRRVRRALIAKKRVQVFKSALDDRYAGVRRISSHDGSGVDAVPVRSSRELAARSTRARRCSGSTRCSSWTTGSPRSSRRSRIVAPA
jgi:thymidine kinase